MKSRRVFLSVVSGALISLVKAADAPSDTPRVEEIAVRVTGAVNKPGWCKLKSGSVVSDALATAGGLTRTGRLEIIILSRREANGEWGSRRLNLGKSGSAYDNLVLRDGDSIYAPEPYI